MLDTNHTAKVGSDVVHLLTDPLPKLAKGVVGVCLSEIV
jgi:hypothetical protein